MIALAFSSVNFNQPRISNISALSVINQQNLLQLIIKILIFIMLHHILFNHNNEQQPEIEEEEPELIVMVSPAPKRSLKK